MKRCVIIGAAQIQNYSKIKSYLSADDFCIFCDGGLKHQQSLELHPDLIVGDFDSADFSDGQKTAGKAQAEIIKLPCEKDDTDVFFAVKEAVSRGFDDFLLIGVIGQRFDHSLCNISVLLYLYEHKKSAVILDDYSEMQIIGAETLRQPAEITYTYSYFSLMCPFGDVSGSPLTNPSDNQDSMYEIVVRQWIAYYCS